MTTQTTPLKIAIIVGSTRPGRNGAAVADWVRGIAALRGDAAFDIVDLAEHPLPHLDEPAPPLLAIYSHEHTRLWAHVIDAYDAYVFVTPEYNHSIAGVLKNAIDFLYAEWNDKAAGFVTYGSDGGVRAAEHLRLVLAELEVATVRSQVPLTLAGDFRDYTEFTPGPTREQTLGKLLDEVVAWGGALRQLRSSSEVSAA